MTAPGFLTVLGGRRVVPTVSAQEPDDAVVAARALAAGGVDVLEVLVRTPAAFDAIAAVRAQVPEVLVGAGTVLDAAQVDGAVAAGAAFVVGPGFSASVAERCAAAGVAHLPGVFTATEVIAARDAGLDTVKLFPATALGPVAAGRLTEAFPGTAFVPTGGIGREAVGAWLRVPGVVAVGGSWLVPPDALRRRDTATITALAAATLRELDA